MSWALAAGFVAVIVILGSAVWESYRTSQREAGVFASLSATAFAQGFCDRALRLAIAGLPPARALLPYYFVRHSCRASCRSLRPRMIVIFDLVLAGHMGLVNSAAFSPDGSRIVTASWDTTARVWDARTGAALATLSGHKFWLNSAAFSPDGGRIVTASWDRTARVWDAKTGAMLAVLSGHTGPVNSAAFSPDGSRVITASDDNTARVWDAKTGAVLATLSGHVDDVNSAAFSPDGSRIVTASFDSTARVWDAATGTELTVLLGIRFGCGVRRSARMVPASSPHPRTGRRACGKPTRAPCSPRSRGIRGRY